MRHGRAKAARKTLQFFRRTHGYSPPYHVLLDGTFVVSILRFKIPLLDRLRSVLQGEAFHLYVTRSTLSELSKLQQAHHLTKNQEDNKAALFEEAYRWAVSNATVLEEEDGGEASSGTLDENDGKNHGQRSTTDSGAKRGKDVPIAAASPDHSSSTSDDEAPSGRGDRVGMSAAGRAMLRIVTAATGAAAGHGAGKSTGTRSTTGSHPTKHADPSRPRPYLFASQDEGLLDAVRSAGCAPVVRLAHNSVLLLEHPSRAAQSHAAQSERHKWSAASAVSEPERELARLVRSERRLVAKEAGPKNNNSNNKHGSEPTRGPSTHSQYQQRKVKKARGPNPLSCRKKDSHPREDASGNHGKDGSKDELEPPSKRRRRRK